MATTNLTAEQIAEAKRFLAAEAKEKSDATYRAISAKLSAAAAKVVAEALACPGVVSAREDSSGFYAGHAGVELHFVDEPAYMKGMRGYYLVLKMVGYTPDGEIKLQAKVKRGYKSGVRTFKSTKAAVKALHAFEQDIWASAAAWRAREAAQKGAQ